MYLKVYICIYVYVYIYIFKNSDLFGILCLGRGIVSFGFNHRCMVGRGIYSGKRNKKKGGGVKFLNS